MVGSEMIFALLMKYKLDKTIMIIIKIFMNIVLYASDIFFWYFLTPKGIKLIMFYWLLNGCTE